MRVPSYRRHSSGQARVTINGKDHLLGTFGSHASKEAYGRLIAEYNACQKSAAFGKVPGSLLVEDVLLAYQQHAKVYYAASTEYDNLKLVLRPLLDLYGSSLAADFSAKEYKAVRQWWLTPGVESDGSESKKGQRARSRQYVNKQMKRTLRVIKWAVGEGMMPPECYTAIKCVEPLRRGRCTAREAKKITCVPKEIVNQTLPMLTQVQADMIRIQQLTGCRPGEVCKLKPAMVNRSNEVWEVKLDEHKTAYRGKTRILYVGPQAQRVLAPYLLRAESSYCFSAIESEQQRRSARHEARKTPLSCGNSPGTNVARRPRKTPGDHFTTHSYARAIRYACGRAKIPVWSPNQLRHNAATDIRKEFGLDAASVILGHSEVGVTQVYAEQDRSKAIEVAKRIG